MPLPSSLDRSLTDQLAKVEPEPATDPTPAVTPAAPGLGPRMRSAAVGRVRLAVRRFGHSAAGRDLVEPFVVERTDPIERESAALRERVEALSAQVAQLVAAAGRVVADQQRTAALEAAVAAARTRIAELEKLVAGAAPAGDQADQG